MIVTVRGLVTKLNRLLEYNLIHGDISCDLKQERDAENLSSVEDDYDYYQKAKALRFLVARIKTFSSIEDAYEFLVVYKNGKSELVKNLIEKEILVLLGVENSSERPFKTR